MSDQNTQPQAPAANTSAPADATQQATDTTRDELPRKLFATRDEAEAAKPANPPKNTRAFQISKGGVVLGWILAIGYDPAISRAAQLDGYSASSGKTAPVTKEAVAAKLAQFTDDELAAMGLSRTPAAPTPTTPTTKGKGKK
jgi:hypothetical protein